MKLSILQKAKTEEEKKELKELFNSSRRLRNALIEILQNKLDASYSSMLSNKKYFMPKWSEFIADQIGYQRAIKEFIKLLED